MPLVVTADQSKQRMGKRRVSKATKASKQVIHSNVIQAIDIASYRITNGSFRIRALFRHALQEKSIPPVETRFSIWEAKQEIDKASLQEWGRNGALAEKPFE